jgi:NDP-sugar pyrophosphorylase family protein
MNKQLKKRLESLIWRAGVMSAVAFINYVVDSLAGVGVSAEIIVLLGLIGGEVTKHLNNSLRGKEEVSFLVNKKVTTKKK